MNDNPEYSNLVEKRWMVLAPTLEGSRSTVLAAPERYWSILRRLSKTQSALLILALAFIFTELLCRVVVGLGDPPLYQADAEIEYLLQPSRTYHRFHNHFFVNRYSMRADDFPVRKSSRDELRVMVVGDSVVYGGVRIDQSEIATEILKRNLERQFHVPVVIANASAKGWGPPDESAYLKRFGTLDADVVILELSSHDYADAPTFAPVVGVAPEFPGKKPRLASVDLFETYIWPRYFSGPSADRALVETTHSEIDIARCRNAERDVFRFARTHHAKVALVQHLSLPELTGPYRIGYAANQQVAREENVPYADDADELRAEIKSGHNPFYGGDPLHLNRPGQEMLAHALQRAVNLALQTN